MNINKININQTEPTYYIASDIYDVSAHNDGATFASLSALLSAENLSTLIPTEVRCGGMTIRFIQNSDNKYVQYRLMSDEFTKDITQWAIDDESVYVENPEFLSIELDANGNILGGRKNDGTKFENARIDFGGAVVKNIYSSDDMLEIKTDSNEHIISYRKKDGVLVERVGVETPVIKTNEISLSDRGLIELVDTLEQYEIGKDEDALPDYYDSYMLQRVNKINEGRSNTRGYSDGFIFITDIHVLANCFKSPILIKHILKNTSVNKVFFGGDIPAAYGSSELLIEQYRIFTKNWYSRISPYGDFYCAMGNHDFTIRENSTSPNGDTFSLQYTRNVLMGRNDINNNVVADTEHSDSIHFYTDNKNQKIRYIVFNTTDSVEEGVYWGTKMTITKSQTDFIANAVNNCPSDYKIIILSHIPPISPEDERYQYVTMYNFINAIYNKTSVRVNDTDYNFIDSPDVICCIFGHEHLDYVNVDFGGLPLISVACDAYYYDYTYGLFNELNIYPTKTHNSIYEQTFDCFTVDISNSLFKVYRIGGGCDRYIHYAPVYVTAGDTVSLTTSLSNPTWRIFDKETSLERQGDTYTYVWRYKNEHATIDDSGVVSSISSGYSIACAIDTATKEMEYYIVIID